MFDRGHRAITVGIVTVMTMFAFEGIGVAAAMPVVAQQLNGLASYSWAFNGYVVASLVGMVLAGEWNDHRGPEQPLIAGVALFGLGALLCGAAWSMPVLIAGRFVQGLGGGIGIVTVYVILGRGYDDQLRPRAFALLSSAWVVPAIIGPAISGYLVDNFSWRAVFWLVIPFVFPPLIVLMPRVAHLGAGLGERVRRPGRIRLALIAALGLAAFQEGGLRLGLAGVATAAVGLVLLLPSVRRLLPDGALRFKRGLPTVVMLRGLLAGAFFAGETFVPLALQTQRGLSIANAGLILTIGALGWASGSQIQGRYQQRIGQVRLLRIGVICTCVSLLTLPLCLTAAIPVAVVGVSWMLGAFGMGLGFGIIGNLALSLSAPEDQGINSASLQVCDSVGSVLAIGAAGAIYAHALAAGTVGPATFTTIWLIMAGLLGIGIALCSRVLPAVAPITSIA